jgi:hypothetical protein
MGTKLILVNIILMSFMLQMADETTCGQMAQTLLGSTERLVHMQKNIFEFEEQGQPREQVSPSYIYSYHPIAHIHVFTHSSICETCNYITGEISTSSNSNIATTDF